MKKQAISLALVLAMLVTTVLVAVPASAVNTTHTAHCACNDKAVGVGSHTECTVPENWTALTDANWADIANGGNFYLADNITATAANAMLTLENDVTLCLNGKTITTGNNKLFLVSAKFNITDCKGTGAINSAHKQTSGTGARGSIFNTQSTTGEINIFGGTFTANQDAGQTGSGAVAYVKSGTLNIYNGTLNGTSASMGGVLNVCGDSNDASKIGHINMYGGIVQGGSTADRGGNVFINNRGIMNMYGGVIRNGICTNSADKKGGGNVYVSGTGPMTQTGQFNLYGGSVLDGNADSGSNIYVYHYGAAKIYGGIVMGGKADADSFKTRYNSEDAFGTVSLYGGFVQLTKDTDMTANATKFVVDSTNQDATESLVIDLNGKTLSGDKAAITGKIGLADSRITAAAGQSVVANVNIADFGLADIKQGAYSPVGRYVTLEKDGELYIHRIYIGVTDVSLLLDGKNVGMGYTTGFQADADVAALIESFGIEVYLKNGTPVACPKNGSEFVAGTNNKVTAHVENILKDGTDIEHLATEVCAKTFVVINGEKIYSNEYAFSLQTILQKMADPTLELPDSAAALLAEIEGYYGDGFYNN